MSIIHFDELRSTSDELRRMADEGRALEPFDAIRADFQTAGRGQVGNAWESERGRNLLISVYARPKGVDVARQFVVSMAVSIAVAETAAALLPSCVRGLVRIKWPNDIYVGDRKLAGILVENRLSGRLIGDTIIGVGLNLNQEVFRSSAPNPVSVKNLAAVDSDVEAVAEALVRALRLRLAMADEGDDTELMRLYWGSLYRADGAPHPFADAWGRFSARIAAVMPDGRMELVTTDGQRRSYLFKEVEHVIALPGGGEITPNL